MRHFKILAWFDSSQVMWHMKSTTKNIVYELLNDLRLRKFGNYRENPKMDQGRA